jgi:four helix bundle protein
VTPDELRRRFADFAVAVRQVATPLFGRAASRADAEQLTRAASSAAANHRAAGRARSHREFTSMIGEALEEVDEAVFWLEHLIGCKDLVAADVAPLINEARELLAILTSSHGTARRKDEAESQRKASRRDTRRRRRDSR